jgi:hypothetical protein
MQTHKSLPVVLGFGQHGSWSTGRHCFGCRYFAQPHAYVFGREGRAELGIVQLGACEGRAQLQLCCAMWQEGRVRE